MLLVDLLTGQLGPYTLVSSNLYSSSRQTHERSSIDRAIPCELDWSSESQISNWRLSIRNTQIFGDLGIVLCSMSIDRTTLSLYSLSNSPIGGLAAFETESAGAKSRR